ncbi:unnamed protein product [Nippostrongylus brasiliensis]|uniref:Polysaccharide biosynthesis protein n=1 Tax=Nippostrongylus brasiliensis TaxID=27835 RepID=A0A0N4YUT3_NIPBR|nr:unnamed protein product [Nippostrongylus brasiliensis]
MWEPTLIAQTANTVIATLASLVLNGYVTYRILTNHNNLTNYQNLLVGQAALYIFGSVICLVANERMNLQMEYMVGYPFVTLNYAAEVSIKCLLDDTQIAQECLLMIFNVHRVLIFLRQAVTVLFGLL